MHTSNTCIAEYVIALISVPQTSRWASNTPPTATPVIPYLPSLVRKSTTRIRTGTKYSVLKPNRNSSSQWNISESMSLASSTLTTRTIPGSPASSAGSSPANRSPRFPELSSFPTLPNVSRVSSFCRNPLSIPSNGVM